MKYHKLEYEHALDKRKKKRAQTHLFMLRWLMATRAFLLQGLGMKGVDKAPPTLDDFLKLYRFKGIHDESSGKGWTPLRYAVIHGMGKHTEKIVDELIERGAKIEGRLTYIHTYMHT